MSNDNKESQDTCSIMIVGGGVLGVTLSFWLSQITNSRICVIEESNSLASGTTDLNSRMLEGPFFYDPAKMGIFGSTVSKSRELWRSLNKKFPAPWKEVGSLEIALDDQSINVLEKHLKYSQVYTDGPTIRMLDAGELNKLEPNVRAVGALYSSMDAAVDFRVMTSILAELAANRGVKFITKSKVIAFREKASQSYVDVISNGERLSYEATYIINAAGPAALELAHTMGLARNLADLYIGSYYWEVGDEFNIIFSHHILPISKYSSKYPFLEPYLAVRTDGSRHLGPKPFLVASPDYVNYGGQLASLRILFKRPIIPKIMLLKNTEFLGMLYGIKGNLFSEGAIISKVKKYLPIIDKGILKKRLKYGKRSLIIGNNGFLHPTSILQTDKTIHILQYYEPGATGTPAFAALLANYLRAKWGLVYRPQQLNWDIWDFYRTIDLEHGDLSGLFI